MAHLFDPKKIQYLDSPERDEWQKPKEIIEAIKVGEGNTIIDYGAGTGYFAVRLAEACTTVGNVIAIDIQQEMIDYLKQRVLHNKISNITVVKGDGVSVPVPSDSVDLIFIANTFHELGNRERVVAEFQRALKKEGRLVIVDWDTVESPVGPPITERLPLAEVVRIASEVGLKLKKKHAICNYQYVLEFTSET